MPLRVGAPRLVRRDRPALAFAVDEAPGRFVAVEAASDPRLLAARDERTPATFWASWASGRLAPPGEVGMDAAAWALLRAHDRLHFRAHSSAQPDAWREHATTLGDGAVAAAPFVRLCDCWAMTGDAATEAGVDRLLDRAAAHDAFAAVDRGTGLQALVFLHRFTPRRPTAPDALEWVVILEALTSRSERSALVQRFRWEDLALVGAWERSESVLDAPGDEALRDEARPWSRREAGPFAVYQDQAPPPGEEGGTCVTLPPSERCLYFARTRWAGPPEVVVPA